jgi:hypothetical protein
MVTYHILMLAHNLSDLKEGIMVLACILPIAPTGCVHLTYPGASLHLTYRAHRLLVHSLRLVESNDVALRLQVLHADRTIATLCSRL